MQPCLHCRLPPRCLPVLVQLAPFGPAVSGSSRGQFSQIVALLFLATRVLGPSPTPQEDPLAMATPTIHPH